ncbi:MAG: DUF4118 domain-containing protein [Cytophagales bacterium]|nr:DUF4118 domain-containing protein [Cytophagales bacterium]
MGAFVVLLTAVGCYFISDLVGYRVVALILLMAVSALAMILDILPVVLAALVSALIWNFFFIPPIFTLHIGSPEDALMFLMYFLIALINAVLTSKIKEAEKKARDRAEKEKTIALYNTFLNSLSHELRTPLATIIAAVDTLQTKTVLPLATQRDLLLQVDLAAERLNRQVTNLLSMGRIDSGIIKPKPDWCDLNEIVNTVLNQLVPEQGTRKVNFVQPGTLPLFWLDRIWVEQILINVVRNALQHTPEDSQVEIEVRQEAAGCMILVSDTGNGIPEEQIHRIFEKFYRGPLTLPGGSGLGLSIAKGYTDALHGSITVANKLSGGALFSIYLPARMHYVNYADNE